MISVLLNSSSVNEIKYIRDYSRYVAAKISDDEWDYCGIVSVSELIKYLDEKPLIDVACIDITPDGGITCAKKVRGLNECTALVVISDATVSPVSYITPEIMPTALILRPFDPKQVQLTIRQTLKAYVKKTYEDDASNKMFVVESREGRRPIPYDRINYFEARNKKIYLITDSEEFSFYDTIDNLESNLPGQFIRCHRGFIVNSSCISKIKLSQNTICLESGDEVPLSRSYKQVLKELSIV